MMETITCQADRKIGLWKSVNGIPNQYLAIQSVDGAKVEPIVLLGEANAETRTKVKKCSRCVGSPKRVCDLSVETKTDLKEQTE